MGLHQSIRFRYKHFKYFAYGKVESLQTYYFLSFSAKNRINSMQCTLYGNSNNICKVKAFFTKKNLGK